MAAAAAAELLWMSKKVTDSENIIRKTDLKDGLALLVYIERPGSMSYTKV